jgi:NADH-quinone oxidoreductase subunit A
MAEQYLPILLTFAVSILVAGGLLGVAALLGQRPRTRSDMKHQAYESGVPLIDRALKRISIKFYLVALVFVVLDVEVAFLYPWAVTYRGFLAENAVVVLWDMLAFIVLLAFAYVYLWKKGVFDWLVRPTAPGVKQAGGEE